jgi:hypothetical protein
LLINSTIEYDITRIKNEKWALISTQERLVYFVNLLVENINTYFLFISKEGGL